MAGPPRDAARGQGGMCVAQHPDGGMLKLEPHEADRLPVPAPAVVEAAAGRLASIRPQVAGLLRGGKLVEAAKLVDDVMLVGELGMSRADVPPSEA